LSITYSGNIHNEIGAMRFLCNQIAMSDGFEKQNLAPIFPKTSCERLILGDMYTSGGQESAQLLRLLDMLPSLCENAVISGLA